MDARTPKIPTLAQEIPATREKIFPKHNPIKHKGLDAKKHHRALRKNNKAVDNVRKTLYLVGGRVKRNASPWGRVKTFTPEELEEIAAKQTGSRLQVTPEADPSHSSGIEARDLLALIARALTPRERVAIEIAAEHRRPISAIAQALEVAKAEASKILRTAKHKARQAVALAR